MFSERIQKRLRLWWELEDPRIHAVRECQALLRSSTMLGLCRAGRP